MLQLVGTMLTVIRRSSGHINNTSDSPSLVTMLITSLKRPKHADHNLNSTRRPFMLKITTMENQWPRLLMINLRHRSSPIYNVALTVAIAFRSAAASQIALPQFVYKSRYSFMFRLSSYNDCDHQFIIRQLRYWFVER